MDVRNKIEPMGFFSGDLVQNCTKFFGLTPRLWKINSKTLDEITNKLQISKKH